MSHRKENQESWGWKVHSTMWMLSTTAAQCAGVPGQSGKAVGQGLSPGSGIFYSLPSRDGKGVAIQRGGKVWE